MTPNAANETYEQTPLGSGGSFDKNDNSKQNIDSFPPPPPPPPFASDSGQDEDDHSQHEQGDDEKKKRMATRKEQEPITNIERRVVRALEALREDSVLFAPDFYPKEPQLKFEDLRVGSKLGSGGYNTVYLAQLPHDDKVYAVKALKSVDQLGQASFETGAADLACEGWYLSRLRHRNLIRMHAMSKQPEDEGGQSFLVMDLLDHTLLKRMQQWKRQEKELEQHKTNVAKKYWRLKRLHLNERLMVAMEIASVLRYLHENKVVYRDLKPENIGFDAQGVLKLFDFGLAKEMKNPLQTGQYRMSGETGSWDYMAPEVAKCWNYDASVDVYSFGVLLWELCSLESAFEHLSTHDYKRLVIAGEWRPPMDTTLWPTELQWLIKRCWSYFASRRPTWEVILDTLHDVMEDIHHGVIHHRQQLKQEQQQRQEASRQESESDLYSSVRSDEGKATGSGDQLAPLRQTERRRHRQRVPSFQRDRAGGGGDFFPRHEGERWVVSQPVGTNNNAAASGVRQGAAPRLRRIRQATDSAAASRSAFFLGSR